MQKRVVYHILFWLSYLLWSGYILGSYDDNFYRAFMSDLAHMPLKITVTYFLMYYMLPRYLEKKNYLWLLLLFISLVIASALLYRVTIYKITWPYFYPESTFYFWNLARLLSGIFDVFSIAGIAVSIKLFGMRIKSQQREEELKREKVETELRFLRAQMNPHFLFNTLNSIYALARAQSAATPDAIMKLSKILRYVLYENNSQTSLLENELKIIDDYIILQKLRFGKKIEFIDTRTMDKPTMPVAQLLLLPLVENAFKHAANSITEIVRIEFNLRLKDGILHLRVKNPSEEEKVNAPVLEGIGLSNIKRQLQLLYDDYNFVFGQNSNSFIVDLMINLKSYKGHELPDSGR